MMKEIKISGKEFKKIIERKVKKINEIDFDNELDQADKKLLDIIYKHLEDKAPNGTDSQASHNIAEYIVNLIASVTSSRTLENEDSMVKNLKNGLDGIGIKE